MPKGIYKRTEENKRNIGLGLKGHTPWNKNKNGVMPPPWNKDLTKETDERVNKYGLKNRGRYVSPKTRKQQSETRKKLFKERRLIHPMLGRHHTEETKRRAVETRIKNGSYKHTEEQYKR